MTTSTDNSSEDDTIPVPSLLNEPNSSEDDLVVDEPIMVGGTFLACTYSPRYSTAHGVGIICETNISDMGKDDLLVYNGTSKEGSKIDKSNYYVFEIKPLNWALLLPVDLIDEFVTVGLQLKSETVESNKVIIEDDRSYSEQKAVETKPVIEPTPKATEPAPAPNYSTPIASGVSVQVSTRSKPTSA